MINKAVQEIPEVLWQEEFVEKVSFQTGVTE